MFGIDSGPSCRWEMVDGRNIQHFHTNSDSQHLVHGPQTDRNCYFLSQKVNQVADNTEGIRVPSCCKQPGALAQLFS